MNTVPASDVIIYVLCPLLVIAIAGAIGTAIRFSGRLNVHDSALQLLVNEVNPPDKRSLRDLLADIANKQATQDTELALLKLRQSFHEKDREK